MNKNGIISATEDRFDTLKASVRRVVDAGSERAGELKTKAFDRTNTAVAGGRKAVDATSAFMRAHPVAAIGVAFGVGYLALRLFRRS